MSNMDWIRECVGRRALLEQLAEEAAELAQAALKLIRTMEESGNPTVIGAQEAEKRLLDEVSDVCLVAMVLGYTDLEHVFAIVDGMVDKEKRWVERLKES